MKVVKNLVDGSVQKQNLTEYAEIFIRWGILLKNVCVCVHACV